jgi:hypothetical protein
MCWLQFGTKEGFSGWKNSPEHAADTKIWTVINLASVKVLASAVAARVFRMFL